MATSTPRRPAFIPSLAYQNNRAALKWLESAFGFEPKRSPNRRPGQYRACGNGPRRRCRHDR